jgi:DNA invertase Pin-like site-specific DNA recombinase
VRILTYARVSTVGQERKGQSLPNQERAFKDFIERAGHVRLRAYQESASAGSIDGRAEFSRMLADLASLKPDAVVVDTLDRFTRNLRDGLNVIEELRGSGVGLLPIDWRRDKPINVDDDRDWCDVVDEFTGAERERRRISRRVRRSFEGRRERGATTVNHSAMGLKKVGDRLVPDPDSAWIIQEIDRRLLAYQSRNQILLWVRGVSSGGIRSTDGIFYIAKNRRYVEAGVRTAETQARLDAQMSEMAKRFGKAGAHAHALTGVIACGKCLDLGYRPEESLMCSIWMKTDGCSSTVCRRGRHGDFYVFTHLLEPLFVEFLERWQVPDVLANWETEPQESEGARKADALRRQLSSIEQQEAQLKSRRDTAFDHLGDDSQAIRAQARKALLELERDERTLHVQRQAVEGELAPIEAPRARDATYVSKLLEGAPALYRQLTATERNELARALCRTLGSNPSVSRQGKFSATLRLAWPELVTFEGPLNHRQRGPETHKIGARDLQHRLARRVRVN